MTGGQSGNPLVIFVVIPALDNTMQREIYLVRHGETDYNLKSIVQGRGVDSSLNETGRRQSSAFFSKYAEVPFDLVVTSSLQRTRQTVEPFLTRGIPHHADSDLDEIDWGIYEGVAHDPEMHQRYLSIIEAWRTGQTYLKIDGGESADQLFERVSRFIGKLRGLPGNTILVCSHGRTIRTLLCAMTGTPLARMDDFPHANTTLYRLRPSGTGFTIDLFNNTDHLDGDL